MWFPIHACICSQLLQQSREVSGACGHCHQLRVWVKEFGENILVAYLGRPWVYLDIPTHVSGGYDFDLISITVPFLLFCILCALCFFVEQRTYLYDWSYLIWYFILLLKCTVDGVDRSYAPRVSSKAIASLNFPQTSIPLKQHPLLKVYFS